MTVERTRVGDVLRLERMPVDPDPGVEYVSIGIRSFGKGIFHYEPKPGDQLGSLRFFSVLPDHLVISNIKGWEGAIAVSTDGDAGCIASNRFLPYGPVDDRIDVRWARWFFLSDSGIHLIQRASPGSADRNRTLAIDRFEALEIPLPLIDEQRRVADLLDKLEGAAADLRHRSDHAVTLAGALAVSTAARPDLPQKAKTRSGWRRVKLGTVMAPADGVVPVEPDGTYPNVGIYSYGRGLFAKPDIDGSTTSATSLNRIRAGQFIYSRLFAFEGAYTYVPDDFDGYHVSNEFPAFDVDPERLNARWLANYLLTPDRWTELRGASKGLGVRPQRVPVEAVMDYEVWLPPVALQRSMVTTLDRLDRTGASRAASERRIASLVPSALNQVFASLS